MRNWIVLSIIVAVLAAGCASVPATAAPTLNPSPTSSGNQEERLQKLLVGTWNGYIKSTSNVIISYNTPTMQIFRVKRTPEGKWSVALSLNGKKIDTAELIVNDVVVMVEFTELYANLLIHHSLVLYGERRLAGKIWYKLRYPNPSGAEVTFEKTY